MHISLGRDIVSQTKTQTWFSFSLVHVDQGCNLRECWVLVCRYIPALSQTVVVVCVPIDRAHGTVCVVTEALTRVYIRRIYGRQTWTHAITFYTNSFTTDQNQTNNGYQQINKELV